MAEKRFLIVAVDLGDTAPGAVFRTIIKSLSKYADIDVVSAVFDKKDPLEGVGTTKLHHYRLKDWNTTKKLWKTFRFNPNDCWWILINLRRAMQTMKGKKYHGVISFTSMNYFPAIGLGRILAGLFRLPWSIYTVDGIPSPVEWLDGDDEIHSLLSSHINRSTEKASCIFSSNEYMMRYQKRVCHDFKGKWSYLYTPYKRYNEPLPAKSDHEGYNFLYAGSLYGLRKIDGLLAAFRSFSQEHPRSKLIFVGNSDPSLFEDAQDLIQSEKIVMLPFTDDLTPFYKEADVLVDIGADISDDVFLSSKIVSYLPVDRPILAVTGDNSPVRGIMNGLNSIVHCRNKEDEAYKALYDSIKAIDYCISDRAGLLKEFDAETIARKLYDNM